VPFAKTGIALGHTDVANKLKIYKIN